MAGRARRSSSNDVMRPRTASPLLEAELSSAVYDEAGEGGRVWRAGAGTEADVGSGEAALLRKEETGEAALKSAALSTSDSERSLVGESGAACARQALGGERGRAMPPCAGAGDEARGVTLLLLLLLLLVKARGSATPGAGETGRMWLYDGARRSV